MLQHVLIGDATPALALVALRGPLVFFLVPCSLLRPLSRLHWLRRLLALLLRPLVSLASWMLGSAAWHVPAAYDYTLRHQTVHDLEHLSFILAGLLVWMQIIDPARRHQLRLSQRLGYMLVLSAAGGVLAAVLSFWPMPLYPAYAGGGARLLGISPLHDQQLAGIVMIAEQLLTLGLCAYFLLRARLQAIPLGQRARSAGLGVPFTVRPYALSSAGFDNDPSTTRRRST